MKKNSIKRILMWFMVIAITLGMLGSLSAFAEGAEESEPFSADIRIKQLTEGPLYYDGSVELSAEVTGADREFTVVWEMAKVKPEEELKWEQFATGKKQILAVTKSYSKYLYRAGAKAEDGKTVYSEIFQIPEPVEQVKETPPEEKSAPADEDRSAAESASAEEKKKEEKPAAEEPASEEPAEEKVKEEKEEKPAAEEPASEEPAEGKVKEEKPAEEEPASEEPTEDKAKEEKPVAEEPVAEEPAEEKVKEEKQATEEPVADEPAPEDLPAEEPAPDAAPDTEKTVPEEETSEEPVPDGKPAETTEEAVEKESAVASEPAEQEPVQRKTVEDYRELLESGNAAKAFTMGSTDVRLDPNGLSSIFTTLEDGTEVTVLETMGDWICVLIGENQIGYIYKDNLSDVPEKTETGTEPAEETEKTEEPKESEAPAETEDESVGEDPAAEMKVTIFTSRRTVMVEGEYVILSSKLEGFDNYSVLYQWECDKGDGFQKVEGADSDNYVFSANTESLSWSWRLIVYYR